jgi:tRNA modification GTPase
LQQLLDTFQAGRILRDGLRLAVVGRPNVGKSSLMNRLVKEDRAIVTDIPGTTRDAVEDFINIKGIPVVIVDTAGLQNTENLVEKIGIEKTHQNIENADLILFVVEEGRGIQAEDHQIFEKIEDKPLIIVINKKDLEDPVRRTQLPPEWGLPKLARISALNGEGLESLEEAIFNFVTEHGHGLLNSDFAPNLRQKTLIQKSLLAAKAAVQSVEREDPVELTALDLDECLAGLDEVLGRTLKEDILDRIFSDFCIGK